MKTNFTPQLQRDACYDGGYDGERTSSYSGSTVPTYVDNRSWFEKVWTKTPTWIKAFVVMFALSLIITIVLLILILITEYISYVKIGITIAIICSYFGIYFVVKEMENH